MSIEFTQATAGPGGVLYRVAGQAAPTWVGYYLPNAAAGGSAPDALTLQQSWSYWGKPADAVNGGCYLLLEQEPAAGDLEALEALLTQLNSRFKGYAYRYLIWCGRDATSGALATLGWVPFVRAKGEAGAVFENGGSLSISSLQLTVPAEMAIEPGEDGESIALRTAGSGRLTLRQTRGAPTRVGAIAGGARLPLSGVTAGGLAFEIDLTVYAEAVENDFAKLFAGVKYFYESGGTMKSQRSPILGVPSGARTMRFEARLDPLHPFEEARTRLTFATGSPFSSSLLTSTGVALTLDPQIGDAGLALAADRVTSIGGKGQVASSYAVLSGGYTVGAVAPCPAGPLPLLCGVSGLETVSVTPTQEGGYAGDTLRFHVGQPAFAPGFPPVEANLSEPAAAGLAKGRLDATMTTAYASVEPAKDGVAAEYSAQPHGAPLFGGESALGLLPLVEQPLGTATAAFPLAAYSGAAAEPAPDGFAPAELAAFEQAVLSPARRAALLPAKRARGVSGEGALRAGQARLPRAGAATRATSPQGFLVTLGGSGAGSEASGWGSLLLAQTVSEAGASSTLEFKPVDSRVQAAFQTNQLALVATKRAWDPPESFHDEIEIEEWPFRLAVGERQGFGSYSNVMVAKFCHGRLADLVADPKRWTDAEVFNDAGEGDERPGLVAVSEWLQAYVAEAVGSSAPELAHFREIVESEQWQGILCLKVEVPLEDLPAQVGALRAGLPQSSFYAHHLGIEVSKVHGETLEIEGSSSLFGLIDYVDPAYAAALASHAPPQTPVPPTPGLVYDFKVLRMLVVFENSEVKEFQSTSQVTLQRWFGDAVLKTRTGSGASVTNSIVIDGALQRHDGQPVYTFASAGSSRFELDSNVLGAVEVLNTTLTTLTDSPQGVSTFRFAFSGLLDFAAVPGLDALSFGSAASGGEGGGLAFSDLYLELAYDPTAATPRVFAFEPAKVAFDVAASTARPASMYAALPLTVKGLLVGAAGGLAKAGFLDVALPGVKRSSLPDAWYGLQLELDLGSPGALAAEVGWSASLVAAWGAGTKRAESSAALAVGLQLPGASGQSKLLSLEGVLKLTIGDLQLRCLQEGVYMLTLRSIALHFLALQFPPSGATSFYLFCEPGATPGQRSPLAWYGAYVAGQKRGELTR